MEGTGPATWEDSSLVQLWGPRFSTYVVAERDRGIFTLGRLPEDGPKRRYGEAITARLEAFLDGRRMGAGEAGRALDVNPNAFRYGAPTGRILIRWDGARQPTVWIVPAPQIDPHAARLELARRYLHVFGPTTPASFAEWAGIAPAAGRMAFEALGGSLVPVRTAIGEGWVLAPDEPALRAPQNLAGPARFLPSGDTLYLLQGADRELVVPDAARRGDLWTSRVWPGALLVKGEIVGTWRRAKADVTISPWRHLSPRERDAAEAEAEALALVLPAVQGPIRLHWL